MSMLVDFPDQQHIVLRGVSWSYYEQTLNEFGNQPIHVAFLDGAMELMSPLPEHERAKKAIANLIVVLAMERRVPMSSFGSTTFRQVEKSAGSEPDECFYFDDLDAIKGMQRYNPVLHRPPDLWIEVDILSPSVPREPICARLGVPEIWRYSNDGLTVRLLTSAGVYADSATSLAFPFLPMTAFAAFIGKLLDGDEVPTLLEFREWLRSLPTPL
jgi:Uma2 family endonuclease